MDTHITIKISDDNINVNINGHAQQLIEGMAVAIENDKNLAFIVEKAIEIIRNRPNINLN